MDANLSMEQIRMDVKNVTALNQEGYDMNVISHKLDLSKDYVQTILTCAQGFTEDDTMAVAVLVEASLYSYIDKKMITGMSGNIFSAFLKCKYCIILQYHITRNSHSVLL